MPIIIKRCQFKKINQIAEFVNTNQCEELVNVDLLIRMWAGTDTMDGK